MINRRKFLSTSAAFGACTLALPRFSTSATVADETVITILHTNDTHSQIDPLPDNDQYAGKGGVARRATLVKRIRTAFQGTPYFNFYKGEVEYKSMSAIGYDAGTLGNHEFDNGVDALAAALKFATFDVVSSNYDVKGTPLEGIVKPYVVKTVGGIRVGLFGLGISPVALITPASFKGITYLDPIETAKNMVKTLRGTERCALVIAMSHLGFYKKPRPRDVGDAQVVSQVDGIDFIAGGHTHTFMTQPERIKQPCGQETIVFQVGRSGIYVGRVDFTFRSGKLLGAAGSIVDLRDVSV
jgi:5'-nucleotidase